MVLLAEGIRVRERALPGTTPRHRKAIASKAGRNADRGTVIRKARRRQSNFYCNDAAMMREVATWVLCTGESTVESA
jgi:hypothetical protein